MIRAKIAAVGLTFLLPLAIVAQQAGAGTDEALSAEQQKEEAELRREIALLLVRETASEIEMLRSITNRISFSSDLAEAAYPLDPELSKRMYLGLADSLSRFIATSSAQISEEDLNADDMTGFRNVSTTVWKLRRAAMVRYQAVLSAAGRDPLVAMDLLARTRFDERVGKALGFGGFTGETQLLMEIVDRAPLNDPETVEELGSRLLKDGLNGGAVRLLSKLKQKDIEAARKYAPKVLSAASREIDRVEPDITAISGVFEVEDRGAGQTNNPVFDQAELAGLAEAFGRLLLGMEAEDVGGIYGAMGFVEAIRPYSPAIAERVARKFGVDDKAADSIIGDGIAAVRAAVDAADADEKAAVAVSEGGERADPAAAEEQKKKEELEKTLRTKEDSPEKQAAIREMISESLLAISRTPDPVAKINAYVQLSRRLEQLGQQGAASEVLDEAFRTVTTNPRNYEEFLQVWTLAGAIVDERPEKAFAMAEDLVFRLNEVIATFHRFAEFMDSRGEMLDEGELQFGGFGGGMMGRFSSVLNSSEDNIKKFVEADLGRTRAMAERFDRPEIRVAAKLLVLNSYLSEKPDKKADEPVIEISTEGDN